MSSIKFEWVHFTGTGNKSGYVVFVKDPSYKLTETEQHQVTATALQTALAFKEDGLAQFYCCKLFTSRATFLYHRMKAHPLPCYNCKDCCHSTCLGCCKICHNHSELIAVLQNFVNKSGKEVNPFLYMTLSDLIQDLITGAPSEVVKCLCHEEFRLTEFKDHLLNIAFHVSLNQNSAVHYPGCCWNIHVNSNPKYDFLNHIINHHHSYEECKKYDQRGCKCEICIDHLDLHLIKRYLIVKDSMLYIDEKTVLDDLVRLSSKDRCCVMCEKKHKTIDKLRTHILAVNLHITPVERNPKQYPKNPPTLKNIILHKHGFLECCQKILKQNKKAVDSKLLKHIMTNHSSKCRFCKMMTSASNDQCCRVCHEHATFYWMLQNLAVLVNLKEVLNTETSNMVTYLIEKIHECITSVSGLAKKNNCPFCNRVYSSWDLLCDHMKKVAFHAKTCCGPGLPKNKFPSCCTSSINKLLLLTHLLSKTHIPFRGTSQCYKQNLFCCIQCRSHAKLQKILNCMVKPMESSSKDEINDQPEFYFSSAETLITAIVYHPREDKYDYNCPICNEDLNKANLLYKHLDEAARHFSVCQGISKDVEWYKPCCQSATTRRELLLHIVDSLENHISEGNMSCEICKSHWRFKWLICTLVQKLGGVNRHMFYHNEKRLMVDIIEHACKDNTCPFCKQKFSSLRVLQMHIFLMKKHCFSGCDCEEKEREFLKRKSLLVKGECEPDLHRNETSDDLTKKNVQRVNVKAPADKTVSTNDDLTKKNVQRVNVKAPADKTVSTKKLPIVQKETRSHCPSEPITKPKTMDKTNANREAPKFKLPAPPVFLTQIPPALPSPQSPYIMYGPQVQCIPMQQYNIINPLQQQRALGQPRLINLSPQVINPQYLVRTCFAPGISPCQGFVRPGIPARPQVIQVQSPSQTLAVSLPQWTHQVRIPQTAAMSQPEVKPAKTSTVTQSQLMHQVCGPSQVPGTSQPQGMQVHRASNVLAVSQPQLIQIRSTSLPPGRSQMMHQVCRPSQTLTASQPQVQSPSQTLAVSLPQWSHQVNIPQTATMSQPQLKPAKTSTVTQPQGMHQECGPSQVPVVKHSQLVKGRSSSQTRETSQPQLTQVHRPSKVSQPQLRQIRSQSLPPWAHQVHIPQTAAMSQPEVKPAKTSTVTQSQLMHQVCRPSQVPIAIQGPLTHQVQSTSQVPGTTPPQLVQVKLTNFVNKSQNKRPRGKNKKNEKNDSDQNSNTMEPPYKIPRYPITNNCSLFQPQKKNVGSCSLFSTESQVTKQTVPDAPAFPRPTEPSGILAITNATLAKPKDTSQFQYNAKKFEVQMAVKNPLLDAGVIIRNIIDAKLFYRAAVVAKGSVQCSGCKSFFPTKEILMVHHIFNLGYCNRCSRLYDARLYEIKLDDDDCEMCVKHIGWKWLMLVMVEYDRIYDNVDDLLQAFFTCFRSVCLYCKTPHNSKNAARAHLWIVLTHMKTCQKWKRYIYPNYAIINVPGNKKSYTAIIHIPENKRSYTGKKLKDISISFNSNAYANIDQREQTVSSTQLPSDTGANQNDLERTEFSNVIVIKPDPGVKLDTGVEPQTDMEVGNERWNQLRTDFQSANEVINVTKTIMKNVLRTDFPSASDVINVDRNNFEEYELTPSAKSISPFDVEIKKDDDDIVMVESSPTANKEEPLEIGRNQQNTESLTILLRDAETNAPDVKIEEDIV